MANAREQLKAAIADLNLLDESADGVLPLTRIRAKIEAAIALLDDVHARAIVHPFAFARYVAEVV